MLLKIQLRWAGHVSRMEDHRLPKAIFFGELSDGYRTVGAPLKRYKDSLKNSLNLCHIDNKNWTREAADRDLWRQKISDATATFESNRRETLKEKRQQRKTRSADPSTSHQSTFPCDRCGRICLSRIGLFSHQRACLTRGNIH